MSEITSNAVITKIDDDKRMVFGWAYVAHDKNGNAVADKSGDYGVEPENLEESAYKFVLNSRNGGAYHERPSDQSAPVVKATMIESMYLN